MGAQLILTVGTNPLPVWVAWYHLKDLKDKLPQPIKVRLVHTASTVNESDRLKQHCQGADFLDSIQTSAGNPGTVRDDIRNILRNLPQDTSHLHVHYTGGTKVMGVETVSAIEAQLSAIQNVRLQTSYLDPRGASGPTIVSREDSLVKDARQNVDLEFNLIALLNGFTLGPFDHTYWDRGTRNTVVCPAPGTPSQEQLTEGWRAITAGKSITDKLLEYGTYAAFKDALERISKNNISRNNCKLFHSVHVQRDKKAIKPFELDVVAVLGYQIVVVSCTVDAKQEMIKQKGMEAILRARQLGGDEARAIILCSTDQNSAKLIEDELKDEMGSASEPLQVWGRNSWSSLPNKFAQYLRNDLHWM